MHYFIQIIKRICNKAKELSQNTYQIKWMILAHFEVLALVRNII